VATKDPEKRRAAAKRYRERQKVRKYGPEAAGKNMSGRHGNHAHGRWNDIGVGLNEDGYVKVRVGRCHPLADPNGYTYLHLLVWVGAGYPRPGPAETIHHRDEDKTNNRVENLELLSRSDHAAHHDSRRGRNEKGQLPKGVRHFPREG
jgi:hypothetical protein